MMFIDDFMFVLKNIPLRMIMARVSLSRKIDTQDSKAITMKR